jgi:hypothetical protein
VKKRRTLLGVDGRRRDEGQAASAAADVASRRKIESPDPALPGSGAGAARAGGAGADPAVLARVREILTFVATGPHCASVSAGAGAGGDVLLLRVSSPGPVGSAYALPPRGARVRDLCRHRLRRRRGGEGGRPRRPGSGGAGRGAAEAGSRGWRRRPRVLAEAGGRGWGRRGPTTEGEGAVERRREKGEVFPKNALVGEGMLILQLPLRQLLEPVQGSPFPILR